ncbi:MAG TPA: helix-turn-helix transcriptional regulator [Lacipirellulaceae bacterium]|nr:helix-turn-helix transcriptional regulator [Lacipirellulaceae bacterium]
MMNGSADDRLRHLVRRLMERERFLSLRLLAKATAHLSKSSWSRLLNGEQAIPDAARAALIRLLAETCGATVSEAAKLVGSGELPVVSRQLADLCVSEFWVPTERMDSEEYDERLFSWERAPSAVRVTCRPEWPTFLVPQRLNHLFRRGVRQHLLPYDRRVHRRLMGERDTERQEQFREWDCKAATSVVFVPRSTVQSIVDCEPPFNKFDRDQAIEVLYSAQFDVFTERDQDVKLAVLDDRKADVREALLPFGGYAGVAMFDRAVVTKRFSRTLRRCFYSASGDAGLGRGDPYLELHAADFDRLGLPGVLARAAGDVAQDFYDAIAEVAGAEDLERVELRLTRRSRAFEAMDKPRSPNGDKAGGRLRDSHEARPA